jgi:hypothetical protein
MTATAPNPRPGGFAHDRDLTHGKEEWLTPREIIKALEFTRVDEALRAETELVPWPFDLDPCAPVDELRPWPTAKRHYSIYDNGLLKAWQGRVWCNPPYGAKTGQWLARCSEHKNVTAFIFARTETRQFFDHVWGKATAVCFLKGRVAFWELACKVCGLGLSNEVHKLRDFHAAVPTKKAIRGGASGAPSMIVTWDQANACSLWDAVQSGRIKGFFIETSGGTP